MMDFLQRIRDASKPRFNELMAFQIAVLCILSWFSFPELRIFYEKAWSETGALIAWVIGINFIILFGIVFSAWNIFVQRKKSLIEKYFMGTYIMIVNGLAGVAAGIEIFPLRWSIMIIFPAWNILTGIFLIYQAGIIEIIVTDEDSSLVEVLITTVISLIVFSIASYGYHLAWGLTLSICIFYSSLATMIVPWVINYFNSQQRAKVQLRKTTKRPKL